MRRKGHPRRDGAPLFPGGGGEGVGSGGTAAGHSRGFLHPRVSPGRTISGGGKKCTGRATRKDCCAMMVKPRWPDCARDNVRVLIPPRNYS